MLDDERTVAGDPERPSSRAVGRPGDHVAVVTLEGLHTLQHRIDQVDDPAIFDLEERWYSTRGAARGAERAGKRQLVVRVPRIRLAVVVVGPVAGVPQDAAGRAHGVRLPAFDRCLAVARPRETIAIGTPHREPEPPSEAA